MIEAAYQRFLTLTNEPTAAAVLALAEVIAGRPTADGPMNIKQAAAWLGISERVARDLIARGELGHCRVGNGRGQIRVLPRDLEAYQNRNDVGGFKHLIA